MQFLWFHKKNSYTEETINLFAKFGFELLKLCAGGDKFETNFQETATFWTWKILSVIIILIQHVMPTRLMHYFSCWPDLYQSSDNRSTTSKHVVAPQCTSIKHRVHGSKGWGCVHWYIYLCSDSKEEHENYVVSASARLTLRWLWATLLKYLKGWKFMLSVCTKLQCMTPWR